jgi:hypothetical protein
MAKTHRTSWFQSDISFLLVALIELLTAVLFLGFLWRFKYQFGEWPQTRIADPSFMCNSAQGQLQAFFSCDLHATLVYLGSFGTMALALFAFPLFLVRWVQIRVGIRFVFIASTLAFAGVMSWNKFEYLVWFLD